jgi:hypothetical protein
VVRVLVVTVFSVGGAGTVRRYFARHPLRRRIIALAAAYAIALASLIASFGAGRAAAEAVAQPGGILCHGIVTGQPAPSPDEGNNKICVDNCCVGCLMLMMALPPPPATAVAVPQASSRAVAPLTQWRLPATTFHSGARPRGPPLVA